MVGFVEYRQEKGKIELVQERRWGLDLTTARFCEPPGLRPRRRDRRLAKMERALLEQGIGRVLCCPGFPYQLDLPGVNPAPFCRWAADVLTLGWLGSKGYDPARSCVALAGPRVSGELYAAAQNLSRSVRGISIDVPGREGEELARELHWEWGLPLVPPGKRPTVRVSFGPVEGASQLCLWEECLHTDGLIFSCDGLELPAGLENPVLSLRWERGMVGKEGLRALRNSPETLANHEKKCYTY